MDKLDIILSKIENIDNKIDTMDQRFDAIDQRLDTMDQRFDAVDQRLDTMDQRFDAIDQRLDTMDQRFDAIDRKLVGMEADIKSTKLTIENEIRTNIMRVAEGHLDLSRRFQEIVKTNNEYEMLTIKVNMLESDVSELKRKIS